jgi:hypothetical protein
MRTMARALVLAAVIFSSTTANAQVGLFGSKIAHHGLYLRGDTGLGFMSTSIGDETFSGLAASFGGALGGSIVPNLIIAGHVFGIVAPSPTYSDSEGSVRISGASLMLWGVGPQITYYFMPVNMYASGTLALTRMAITSDYGDYSFEESGSNVGFGSQLAVGKEWWFSPFFGLGLAGQFSFSANDWGGATSTWAGTLVFSATFN